MIDKEKFNEMWESSGLGDYYRRMDELKDIGFAFENNRCGDMDHWQSQALNEWLDETFIEGVRISDVHLNDIIEKTPKILERALVLKERYETAEAIRKEGSNKNPSERAELEKSFMNRLPK